MMNWWRTAVRSVPLVLLTILTLCAVDALGLWFMQGSAHEAVRLKNTIASMQSWSHLLAEPLSQQDWERVQQLAHCALRGDRVFRIQVLDARGYEIYAAGRVAGSVGSSASGPLPAAPAIAAGNATEASGRRLIQFPIIPPAAPAGDAQAGARVPPAVGFLSAELDLDDGDPIVRAGRHRLLVLGAVLLTGAGFLAWWMHTLHLGTIARLTRKLDHVDRELEKRVALRTRDLHDLAIRDPLTGLYNRRYLDEVIRQEAAASQRYGTNLSFLMIDLDDLRRLNNRFGHQVGDEAIILLASVIESELRSADVAARYGGDEFAVLLPHTDPSAARKIAERVCDKYRLACADQLPETKATLSVGLANRGPGRERDSDGLIRCADAALYRAKSDGKDCVASFSEADGLRFVGPGVSYT